MLDYTDPRWSTEELHYFKLLSYKSLIVWVEDGTMLSFHISTSLLSMPSFCLYYPKTCNLTLLTHTMWACFSSVTGGILLAWFGSTKRVRKKGSLQIMRKLFRVTIFVPRRRISICDGSGLFKKYRCDRNGLMGNEVRNGVGARGQSSKENI